MKKNRKIQIILTYEIDFEGQNFAIFDNFFSTDCKTWKLFNELVVGFV